MKSRATFGLFTAFMALLVFVTTKLQYEHIKLESRWWPSSSTKDPDHDRFGFSGSLPRGIVKSTSDMELKPLWKNSRLKGTSENYIALLAMPVGIEQKKNVNIIVRKFLSANCSIILFHYDGNVDGWHDLEWSEKAIHILAHNQTKWWFAKRFLHPDVVSSYDYIFLWDEDLGVKNFHPGRYLQIMISEGLEISQPALDPDLSEIHHRITIRNKTGKLHRRVYDFRGSLNCSDKSRGPPCTGWVEGMAPVFSRAAWRCVWHLIQNDLIHGWGLDMKLGYCAQGDRTKKVGVIDSEFVIHQGIPSLGGSSANKLSNHGSSEHSTVKVDPISRTVLFVLMNTPIVMLAVAIPAQQLKGYYYYYYFILFYFDIYVFQVQGERSIDLRSQIRRQSTAELQIFRKRWDRAVREDEDWTDPFKPVRRRRAAT